MTTTIVLSAIKKMNSLQNYAPRAISLDTLTLALNIKLSDLTPLIEELQLSRDIVFHPPKLTTSTGTKKSGSVSLT